MGRVEAICIAGGGSPAMQRLEQVEAVVGAGLAGDRYADGIGFYSPRPTDPGAREVTLFEAEVLDRLVSDHGIRVAVDEHRRNLTVRGVRLADLIGKRFNVGEVTLEGVRDCPPCAHLEALTGKPLIGPLATSGGLRARVLVGGRIRVGDLVAVTAPALVDA